MIHVEIDLGEGLRRAEDGGDDAPRHDVAVHLVNAASKVLEEKI